MSVGSRSVAATLRPSTCHTIAMVDLHRCRIEILVLNLIFIIVAIHSTARATAGIVERGKHISSFLGACALLIVFDHQRGGPWQLNFDFIEFDCISATILIKLTLVGLFRRSSSIVLKYLFFAAW